jgi:DNA-3-methyladenine glycosylase
MGPPAGSGCEVAAGGALLETRPAEEAVGVEPAGAPARRLVDEPPHEAAPPQSRASSTGKGPPESTLQNLMRGRESQVLGARKLSRTFYARPVLQVARDCIGKILVHRTDEGIAAGRIVECEAYRGPLDRAAHSSRGLTPRTRAMFGPPGYAYVFLLYGRSWAFNIVVASEGEPHAILVRALEPTDHLELMERRRGKPAASRELTNGPGKLCHALAITGADYGRDLCGEDLFLLEGERRGPVGRSPRINVDYAGVWAEKPWRFFEKGNRYISVPPRR